MEQRQYPLPIHVPAAERQLLGMRSWCLTFKRWALRGQGAIEAEALGGMQYPQYSRMRFASKLHAPLHVIVLALHMTSSSVLCAHAQFRERSTPRH